jgi:hypothetical protein
MKPRSVTDEDGRLRPDWEEPSQEELDWAYPIMALQLCFPFHEHGPLNEEEDEAWCEMHEVVLDQISED